MKKSQLPRHRRLDIIQDLPKGGQKKIANTLKVSTGYVSAVLNGHRNPYTDLGINVMRMAEHMAARNKVEFYRERMLS